jgi:methylenetetrahydrofolate dehydrogenase (NADP+)/methenyltetrahydrofolate cyclohydrolase
MTAQRIDGKAAADALSAEIRREAAELRARGRQPYLYALEVGSNAAARSYMDSQGRRCADAGIRFEAGSMPPDSSTQEVVERVQRLNADAKISSIIVLTPVPGQVDLYKVLLALDPSKDAEGVSPANIGLSVHGHEIVAPCTARSVMHLIRGTGVAVAGAEAVVVGHSEMVGKPIALLLMKEMATVTVCHAATKDLAAHTRRADILVCAVGKKAGLITAEHVKPGAVVIDVGVNQAPLLDQDGRPVTGPEGKPRTRIAGDVDFESVSRTAGFLTPVPGGVGPMTVAYLLKHVVEAAGRGKG